MSSLPNGYLNDFEVIPSSTEIADPKKLFDDFLLYKQLVKELPGKLLSEAYLPQSTEAGMFPGLFREICSEQSVGLFRKSADSHSALCTLWKSRITSIAKLAIGMRCVNVFQGIDSEFMKELAKQSSDEQLLIKLPDILAKKGIILIYEKAFPAMKLDGVVFKAFSGNPVIGISFRYSRIDYFWFTLMHELAHIVLHEDRLANPIYDDIDTDSHIDFEIAANRLAGDSFVSRSAWRTCPAKRETGDDIVIRYAKSHSIHPAIVAGRLQKEMNWFDRYRNIVDSTNTRKLVFGDE